MTNVVINTSLKTGDKIHNNVPAHYFKKQQGEILSITNTQIVVKYNLNGNEVKIHHNIYDKQYFKKVR